METLQQFYQIAQAVWNETLADKASTRYLVAFLIFIFFLMLRKVFSRFVIGKLRIFVGKTKTRIDDTLLSVLEKPLHYVPVVLGAYFALQYLSISGFTAILLDRLVQSLIVVVLFWCFINLLEPVSDFLHSIETFFTPSMRDWMIKAARVVLICIGVATVLDIWGIKIGPIIAGFGLLGVAVALGAQDLFKNLISGILILGERRFMRGDWIRVEGVVEGTVETIGFRSTRIRRFDKAPVFVPNSKLSDSLVINFSKMTNRRIYWNIRLVYRTTVDQLRTIRNEIETYIRSSDKFAKPPEAELFVHIDRFDASSINILLYCFTVTKNWGEWLIIKEELTYKIKEIVENTGSAFAFPSRSVYMEPSGINAPETFIPPVQDTSGKNVDIVPGDE